MPSDHPGQAMTHTRYDAHGQSHIACAMDADRQSASPRSSRKGIMQGNSEVIDYLNRYLSFELTGFKQYLLHSRSAADQGYERLAQKQLEYSNEETAHAARIIDRILLLEGAPLLADRQAVSLDADVLAQIRADRQLVTDAIAALREGIACCERASDFVTRTLLREMLDDEEQHLHWLEVQLELADKIGVRNYLQSQG